MAKGLVNLIRETMVKIDITKITELAREAGSAIMQIYKSNDFQVELKDDRSPLTKADKASHEIIKESLQKWYPEIPLLSEEGREIPFEERELGGFLAC